MGNNYGFNKYKQTSVTTASRGQVLLMLYESSIKYTKMAIEAMKAKDLARKGQAILKIQDIINELSLSLNHEVGGDISRELERLYLFMVEQITQANIRNDVKPLETTQKLLETLYDGWKGAVEQLAKFGGDPAAAAASEIAGGKAPVPTPGPIQKNAKER
ncbi:MAG: flagellar export chaperone FliS [Deltaproteobacteria bacterium]|nr:flagellar export chaperone FliS [Deltaproteobacteria bacterium]